jgi:hypothetical protein
MFLNDYLFSQQLVEADVIQNLIQQSPITSLKNQNKINADSIGNITNLGVN